MSFPADVLHAAGVRVHLSAITASGYPAYASAFASTPCGPL